MSQYDFDMGIIGGGAAGLTIASGAAQLGAKTLLIEKEDALGGDCLHFGCVPSKTLIKSAHVYHLMKTAADYGLPSVDVPPVEFSSVRERIRSVIGTIQKHDSPERFCGLGVQVQFGSPRFVDEHTVEVSGRQFTAKNWTIATGSSAAVPPIPGLDRITYLTNRQIFYMDQMPEELIILGAGPIGIEMAQAFNRLGCAVTVVDRADQILIKEDKEMADMVMAVLESEGVRFHLNSAIESVNETGQGKTVQIKNIQGRVQALSAQAILVAMGRAPNVDDLGLESIGVRTDRTGIYVDSRLRTSQKHIYAAGDANGGFQFTHAAGYEGGIVISNAIFHLPRKVDYTYLPWCTYSDPELASIGMNEKSARQAGLDPVVLVEDFKDNDRSQAEGRTVGRIKLVLDDKERPLGVQIVGLHAGEFIGEWVAALNGNTKLSTIASAIHPYPTLAEISKRVAGSLYSPKIFSDRVRKGLKFFFNLKGRACTISEDA